MICFLSFKNVNDLFVLGSIQPKKSNPSFQESGAEGSYSVWQPEQACESGKSIRKVEAAGWAFGLGHLAIAQSAHCSLLPYLCSDLNTQPNFGGRSPLTCLFPWNWT